MATRGKLPDEMLNLMPELQKLAPPAMVLDKMRYSAFAGTDLYRLLEHRNVSTLVITGAETDVCVLSTVLDAVDHGYRVILCAGRCVQFFRRRARRAAANVSAPLRVQIEVADADQLLAAWRDLGRRHMAPSSPNEEGPPCSGPSIVLSAMGGDFYAPLTRGETHEEIVVPRPTFAANDNETLDHLLSMVDDKINVGAFRRFGKGC